MPGVMHSPGTAKGIDNAATIGVKEADSVAQLVEHRTFNARVVGSSPTGVIYNS